MTGKQFKLILLAFLVGSALYARADIKRESRHFITTEAGIGYSALLNNSDIGRSAGLAGGKLQVGYEWNYRKLIVHTGLEFAMLSNTSVANPFTLETPYTQGLPSGLSMTQHFDFQSYKATQLMGQVNIPIQAGMVFSDRYYFLAGARIGLPVMHSASTTAQVNTYLTDPYLIGNIHTVPGHDAYTSTEKASFPWASNIVNAQVSAEFGVVLNSFFDKSSKTTGKGKGKGKGRNSNAKRSTASNKGKQAQTTPQILYRVGVFADYGVTSCFKQSAAPGALVSVAEPRQMTFNDYFAVANKPVNSLLVGIKFAVLFQLNQPKPEKPLPSYFDIYIADASTGNPVPASLAIYEHAKNKTTTKSVRNGHLKYRAKDGDYTFTATNEQYLPASQDASIAGEDVTETIRLALTPKPQPVVIDTPVVDIPIVVGTKVVLHNLFFATNKTTILPESKEALDDLSAFMASHPQVEIRITGHTDNVGSDQANQILSEGRANAVRDELIRRGVAPDRIEADGKGETEPIADNATEEGRAKNRRVEFTIISTGDEDIEQLRE